MIDDRDIEGSPRVGLRERKKARTREDILTAATELFAEVGYRDARTAVIAERAEVAEATLFRYFATKADLAIEPFRRSAANLVAAVEARPAEETPFVALVAVARSDVAGEFFTERAHEHMDRMFANPELTAMAFQLLLSSADQLASSFSKRLGSPPSDPRPKVLAYAALGAVLVSIEDWILGDVAEPQQRFIEHLEVLRPVLP